MRLINKYTKLEQMIFPELCARLVEALEQNPNQDFLGDLYMQLELGNHWKGQFFTPYSICKLMAEVIENDTLGQINKNGYVTINDCACGAGATLIAYVNTLRGEMKLKNDTRNWQNHVMVTAQDIDTVTGLMCYIQLSLLGCSGYVKIADTLRYPMATGDDLMDYWFTPMYYSDVWMYRRIFQAMDKLTNNKKEKTKLAELEKTHEEPLTYVINLNETKNGQLSLF